MSVPLDSRPLVKALIAMLENGLGEGCPVHWAGAPQDAVPPFVVIYPDSGMKSGFHRSLTNDGPDELRYQITAVGSGPEQALWAADKAAAALLGGVPSLAGRRVWPAVEESSQPVRRDDESTGVFLATAQYLTRSDPA